MRLEYNKNWTRIENSRIGIYTADILIYKGKELENTKKQFTKEPVKLAEAQRMLRPSTERRFQFFHIWGTKTKIQIAQLM